MADAFTGQIAAIITLVNKQMSVGATFVVNIVNYMF